LTVQERSYEPKTAGEEVWQKDNHRKSLIGSLPVHETDGSQIELSEECEDSEMNFGPSQSKMKVNVISRNSPQRIPGHNQHRGHIEDKEHNEMHHRSDLDPLIIDNMNLLEPNPDRHQDHVQRKIHNCSDHQNGLDLQKFDKIQLPDKDQPKSLSRIQDIDQKHCYHQHRHD
jgi:hypothetical protein